MARFTDKRILITGGSSGLGLAGARRIVAEGGHVILTGRNADRLQAAARDLGDAATVLQNDAADPDAAGALAEAIGRDGKLDGLWLNAGFASSAPIEQVTAQDFDDMMAVNVRGPVLQLAALSPLIADGGSVVVTSSTASYDGGPTTSLYAAAKGAVISAARSWARALGPRGIRVNTLVPGAAESSVRDFMSAGSQAKFESAIKARTALGRIGTADEVAAVALFLLSDDAAYVTGSQYAVDGGMAMT